MELKDQVCSLESAKRLKDLGVKQESLFYWFKNAEHKDFDLIGDSRNIYTTHGSLCFKPRENDVVYSAFTVAELGEMLPNWIITQKIDGNRGWICDGDNEYGTPNPYTDDLIEVEARAKMLIYLIENKLI